MKEIALQNIPVVGLPAKLKATDQERSLDQLSYLLDGVFRIPGVGWRFGLDAVIGLVPGVGDTLTSLASFYILIAAVRQGVPKVTLLRMGLNIAIDYLVGSIPVVGDVFDAMWKSNQMNVELIRKRATSIDAQRTSGTGDWLFVGAIIAALTLLLVGSIAASLFYLNFLISLFR